MLALFDSVALKTEPLSQPCFPQKCGHIPLIGILDTAALPCSHILDSIGAAAQVFLSLMDKDGRF